jgi:hypothetical protein
MTSHIQHLLIALTVSFVLLGCNGGDMPATKDPGMKSIDEIDSTSAAKLRSAKIFFGHRSVGFNIIKGLEDIFKEKPNLKLNLLEIDKPMEPKSEWQFIHAKLGENSKPLSKINDFANYMSKGIGNNVDIAFFKFCFVDIHLKTNIQELFEEYKSQIKKIKKEYPDTQIVHLTVPLYQKKTTAKTFLKRLIKRKVVWEYDIIVKQNQYNDLIRKEYSDIDPIFDIAELESTLPDGRRTSFKRNKKIYYSLAPEYTNDGGHLNLIGRKRVAEQLLILLAELIEKEME